MQPQPPSLEQRPSSRVFYLDALRALAAFLVIVNHTGSQVFQASDPSQPDWWLSLAWYYLSKIAVPLFVMISGALLLPRRDSYRRAAGRVLRMLGALVLFSYFYYLWNLWLFYWTWEKAFDLPAVLAMLWRSPLTDSFWYLYFYLGILVMLPILQRLAAALEKKDLRYLIGGCFLFGALWPLLAHYAPGLRLPRYFDAPLFSVFIGLLFAGHYFHAYARPSRAKGWLCLGLILGSIALSLVLTRLEYSRLGGLGKYWFMDERTAPSITIILCALGVMFLPRCWPRRREPGPLSKGARVLAALGHSAFGIYLLQDWVIRETKRRVFAPLLEAIPALAAVVLWEMVVFALAAAATGVMRRVPGLKKLL